MALEFALGVIPGVVTALISSLLQNRPTVGAVHELTREQEVIIERRSFDIDNGRMVHEERLAFIERHTFVVPPAARDRDVRLPAIAGVVVFAVVFVVLVFVGL